MAKKLPYREGDAFTVPLPEGGLAVGVVARADGRGILVGYFFGPRRPRPPETRELAALRPGDALLVARAGDLGLLREVWTVLGPLPDWDRTAWPIPPFGRTEPGSDRALRVEYADGELAEPAREAPTTPEEVARLRRDGLLGYGAAEKLLDHLLAEVRVS